MSLQPNSRMNVDEFLAWAETQPGKYELVDGEIFAMSPQKVRHAETKFAVQIALRAAIRQAGLSCHVLPDGVTIRVDASTAYEPDALVYCGSRPDGDATELADPVIVIEVLSPATKPIDTGTKLEGYFRVPSIQHYLVVDPRRPMVIHHRRGPDEIIETRVASSGQLDLSPPGLRVEVASFFDQP